MQNWTKTRVKNLVRHKGGGYYARLYVNGQESWRSLKTKHQEVAKARLAKILGAHRENRPKASPSEVGKLTLADASRIFLNEMESAPNLKASSLAYTREVVSAILKTWPSADLDAMRRLPAETSLRGIREHECRSWASVFHEKYSGTRFNAGIGYFKKILQIAVKEGLRHDNPAIDLKRKRVVERKLILPTREEFKRVVDCIAHAGGRFSSDCAALVEFLAYTGCRLVFRDPVAQFPGKLDDANTFA